MAYGIDYSGGGNKKVYGISDAYRDSDWIEKVFLIFLFILLQVSILGFIVSLYFIWR